MFRKKVRLLSYWLASGDYILMIMVFMTSYYLRFNGVGGFFSGPFFSFLLLYLLVWSLLAGVWRLYSRYFEIDWLKHLRIFIQVLFMHALIIIALNGVLKTYFSRILILYTYGILALILPIWRILFNRLLRGYFSLSSDLKQALFVGSEQMEAISMELNHSRIPAINIKGYFGEALNTGHHTHLGPVDKAYQYIQENADSIDEIYCQLSVLTAKESNRLIDLADNNLIRVIFIPEARGLHISKLKFDAIGQQPVLVVRPLALDEPINRLIKRVFDLFFSSLVLLLVLSWMYPIVALLIKLSSPGPVMFKQLRSGLNNNLFWCYKFRTMRVNTESDTKQAERNDSRITRIGAFLRKTSLDEMPQFINVFIGNMSVVGPRPHMISHTVHYSKIINKFMVRHLVKPGITGLSQIKGLRGDTSDPALMRNRVRIDIFYIEYWSFFLDLKIIFLTVYNIWKGDKNAF